MVIPWEIIFYTVSLILSLINESKCEKRSDKMNFIYCYENKLNHHKYVGQTNNLKVRYSAHKSQAFNPNSRDYNCLFHKKIRQYGLENFDFYCLEEINSNDQEYIDSRESYWIKLLNSWCRYGEGYNETTGGKQFKKNLSISDEQLEEIKSLIKNSDLEFAKIAEKFNIYRDFISRINIGRYGFDEKETYPLRVTRDWREVPQEVKLQIAREILETSIPLQEIANRYKVSKHLVQQINSGESNLESDLVFPLRKTNKRLTSEQEDIILQGIINNEKTRVISEKAGVSMSAVQIRRKKYKKENL